MTTGFGLYEDVKESGVEGLGRVPSHWEVRPIKTLFREADIRGNEGVLLSLTRKRGIIPQSQITKRPAGAEDNSKYKLCVPGNIVMNRMQAWSGMFAVSNIQGHISPDYSIFVPIESSLSPEYFGSLFRTPMLVAEFAKRSKGIGDGFNRLYTGDFSAIHVVCPPVQEQSAIMRFLDYMDYRITRYIRAKETLIVLLEEYKRAVIRQAVTGQIDARTGTPHKEYKDSGVEWLGTVPGHWVVKRLKSVTTIASGQVDPQHEDHRSKILIAPNHIMSGRGEIGFLETADQQGADSGKYIVQRGDVLYSKIRPHLRKAAIAPVDGLCSADMYPIRVSAEEISNRYLLHLLLSDQTTKYTVECSLRVAMPKINRESLGSCWIAFPKVEEQLAILSWIHEKTSGVDAFVTTAKGMVALLQEYRTRLIADVVTGKLDVREAAANLPDPDPLEAAQRLNESAIGEGDLKLDQTANLD